MSLPLSVHLFIYEFIFCVAMWIDRSTCRHGPRAYVWDKKTRWVKEFGVTWANKVVKKKKIESAESKLSSGNDTLVSAYPVDLIAWGKARNTPIWLENNYIMKKNFLHIQPCSLRSLTATHIVILVIII